MEKNIFYSWQSDLPNNKNRTFIQDSIEDAVAGLQQERIQLEIAIDRDTQGAAGTPDIVATIFSKIEKANIFIADVSIINTGADTRKTPNPNVLVELGYAAKCIGWDNIICVFNKETGDPEELPFDLRFRRPLIYQIENNENKAKDRKALAERLQKEISRIIIKQSSRDEIRSYIKSNIDKEVLSICNQVYKILYGYDDKLSSDNVWDLLALSQKDIEDKLAGKKFIGFTVLKDWEVSLRHLQDTMNQPFFVQHAEQPFINAILKVIKALELMTSICKEDKIFVDTDEQVQGYSVKDGKDINPDNPKDNFLLLKNLEGEKGIVIDFGEIKPYNQKGILLYQTIRENKFGNFVGILHILIHSLQKWTKDTGNSFIIGPSSV